MSSSSAMCVAGPAVLLFVTVIARTCLTNRAGVWIVRPTHAKIFATILSHSLIVGGSTTSIVSNVCSRGRSCLTVAFIVRYTQIPVSARNKNADDRAWAVLLWLPEPHYAAWPSFM